MKFGPIVVAIALCGAGSVHALDPAQTATALQTLYVSGSSSLSRSFGAYIQTLCNPSTFDVYFDDGGAVGDGIATSEDGLNSRAYSCTLAVQVGNYAAGSDLVVYKRDQGGSVFGVNPILSPVATSRMRVTVAGCVRNVALHPAPAPAPGIYVPSYLCSGTDTAAVPDSGISDVEPRLFQETVNRANGIAPMAIPASVNFSSLVQGVFGVAVNKKLYRRLQEAQGLAQVDPPADQDAWTTADIAGIPSLTTGFVRAALAGAGISGNPLADRGWNVVVPAAPLVTGKTINICRRVEGSGTQAASNIFFALNPCQTGYGATLAPNGSTQPVSTPYAPQTTGTLGVRTLAVPGVYTAVREDMGTGGAENCLGTTVETAVNPNDVADNEAYGLAILSRESNPRVGGGDKGYRFVKLDGVAPTRALAKSGDYLFVFEATMQWNTANAGLNTDKIEFLKHVRSNFGKPASLALFDSDVRQGVVSPPASYTGSYAGQTNVDALAFGSRMARANNNSCTPIRIIK